jgi:hypothetical protein
MPVPKMAKNGQNSVFVFESRITPTRKTWKPGKIKTALKAQKRIKTIFGQFRNTHARYHANYGDTIFVGEVFTCY